MAVLLTACSSEVSSNEMETITDKDTKTEVELVESLEESLLVDWIMTMWTGVITIMIHPFIPV